MGIKDACAGQNAQTGQAASPSLKGGSGLGMESASFSAYWGDGKPIDPRCYAPPEHLQGSNYANAKPVNNSPMEEKVVQGATIGTLIDRAHIAVSELHRRVMIAETQAAAEVRLLSQKADALTAMNANQCETIVMLRKELQTLQAANNTHSATITMLRRDAMKYDGTKERAAAWDAVWQQLQGGNGYRTDLVEHCGTNTAVKQIAELQRKARAFDRMMETAK